MIGGCAAPPWCNGILWVCDEASRPALYGERAWQRASRALASRGVPAGVARASLSDLASAHFASVTVEPFEVMQHVARRDLWPFLTKAIYGLDAMPATEGARTLDELELPDPVPWTVAMVELRCRA